MLKYTTFTHLPNTFQHPQYVPFFSSRVDWLLSYYIVNLSYQVSTCCHVMQFISTTYYYYISILQCHLLLPYCQRFFVVISNAAAIYRFLSCVSIHLTSLHFPCCCSVISFKDAFSLFFRYLYTKFFFATESYALFDDRILLFLHSQIPSVYAWREKRY